MPKGDETIPPVTGHKNCRSARAIGHVGKLAALAVLGFSGIVNVWPASSWRGSLSPLAAIKRAGLTA